MSSESALVALVPEAEELVGSFRERFDPSAAAGVPAHISLLYPFKPPAEITPAVLESLTQLFSTLSSFEVSLTELRKFPSVLYLAPEPDDDLLRLTLAIVKQFPETPPYEGEFAEIIPHLSVAQADNAEQLANIASEFESRATGRLPIRTTIREVCLIENRDGLWRIRDRFVLGASRPGRLSR